MRNVECLLRISRWRAWSSSVSNCLKAPCRHTPETIQCDNRVRVFGADLFEMLQRVRQLSDVLF